MSPVFEKQSGSNKLTPAKGQKLADVIVGATLDDVGLFNWGTKEKAEINRALVELVGCQRVDPADPLQSELDPALGTGGAIYLPKPWKPDAPLDVGRTHTFKLKKRLPMPAVAITELTPWFTPNDPSKKCTIKYRVEGHASRADKTDLEVHVARYRDLKTGETLSSYYEVKKVPRAGEGTTHDDVTNPWEENQAPCGTDGTDDTHIWRDKKTGVAPSSAEITALWDGESQATKGVLGPSGSKYINSTCAPYSVLVRYYKDDADKVATITFDESFCPRWKVESGGTRKLDPTSLVVRWTIKNGPTAKLVLGQLQVFAKNKAVPVFQVALDKDKLNARTLDLAPLWPESEIKRDEMPYRVQIQAHSGPDEAEGLAIAVMPTQVRAPDYKRVQFLAFNVIPPSPYKGDPVHRKDIADRCAAMIDAVQKAKPKGEPATDVLKIFMAPEFYWRGPEGAYPVEEIETIVPKLRAESDKIDYADWMFVFGTAIGYQQHGGTTGGSEIVHTTHKRDFKLARVSDTEVTMTQLTTLLPKDYFAPKVGWRIVQGTKRALITHVHQVTKWEEYTLTLDPPTAFVTADATFEVPTLEVIATTPPMSSVVTSLHVKSRICSNIPPTTVGGTLWKVKQPSVESEITACTRIGVSDEFNLTLKTPGAFTKDVPFELVEPMATEVTNVALVQKGYPSPYMGDGGLRHVAIYKENVSPIDFKTSATNWDNVDGSERLIEIHGTVGRPVLPTEGAADLLGASPQTTRPVAGKTAGSEINATGIGGGVVFTMDDITFGLEVCLDHDRNRLSKFYAGTNKAPGDPTVQVHLIPSWGSSIGSGDICCPSPNGPVFNVDGQRGNSAARIFDGTWSCDIHPEVVGAQGNRCTKNEKHYYCPSCGVFQGTKAGSCMFGHPFATLVPYSKCGGPKYYGCPSGCSGRSTPCAHLGAAGQYSCAACNQWFLMGTACLCVTPKPVAVLCGEYYDTPTCPTCGMADPLCNHWFKEIGAAILTRGTAVAVPAVKKKSFQRPGTVLAYEPVALPLPDIVV